MSYIGGSPKWNRGKYTPQSTDPASPGEGDTFYSDGTPRAEGLWVYTNGVWVQVGSQQQGAINYIDDPDAEGPLASGQWNAYADAADDEPVDGTGGAPTVTITRITSGQLRGDGSFRLTKDAADRQGEGVSTDFVIDEHDKEKVLSISFDYEGSASFLTDDISVWIYDIDNAKIIPVSPDEKLKVGSQSFQGTWLATDADDYRLIIHVASTNASAYTLDFDNVIVGPQVNVFGPAMTDWDDRGVINITATSVNPTKGTTAEDKWISRRVGGSLELKGFYRQTGAGVVGTGTYLFEIPDNLVVDTTLVSVSTAEGDGHIGHAMITGSGNEFHGTAYLYDSTHIAIALKSTGASDLQPLGSTFFSIAQADFTFSVFCTIPIQGWSTNIVTSESKTFNASKYVAAGTRVTTAPAKLGEYRTLIKDASALTFSDDAPSQTTSSIITDGMRIYVRDGSGAGTAGEPWRWEIFVGKNKNVQYRFHSSAGRTGRIDTDFYYPQASNIERGINKIYDPTTGIVSIFSATFAATGSRVVGHTWTGPDAAIDTTAQDCYFDVIVSDQTIAVQTEEQGSGKKLGYDHTIAVNLALGSEDMHASRVIAPTSATINRLSVFLSPNTAGTSYVLGLYADSSGLPGALLAQTVEGTTTATGAGVNFLDLLSPTKIVKDTTYWLVIHADAGITVERAVSLPAGQGAQKFRNVTYSSTMPDPFGTPGGDSAASLSKAGW